MSLYKRPGSQNWHYNFVRKGRKFQGSTGTSSKRQAEKIERDLKKNAIVEIAPITEHSLDIAFGKFWDEHAKHLKSSETVRHHITRLLDRLGDGLALESLRNHHLTDYVAQRRYEVSPATVNRELAVLRTLHGKALLWGWDVAAISWGDLRLSEPDGRTRHLSPDEADALLSRLPEHIEAIVRFALLTGCRRSEITSLTWERVYLQNRRCEVIGKKGRRPIELSDDAFILLANQPRNGKLVFDKTNLRRRFAYAKRAAGISDFRFHDLRHTFATWLRQSGVPLEIVRKALGHSSIVMTTRYAHVEQREVAEAVQKVTTFLTTVRPK